MKLNELDDLIKDDKESQERFNSFKSAYNEELKLRAKLTLRNARRTALMMGFATIVSIGFLLYAFKVKANTEDSIRKLETQVHQLEAKLENCNNK
ncbi:MAG: hypothetical protein KDC79_15190 [Cyclobacteriaceae bacterium]|nr:hypothetical protein [Cyclobacteriaceae bacterium]